MHVSTRRLFTSLSSGSQRGMLWLSLAVALASPSLIVAPAMAASRYEVGFSTSATLLRMNDRDLDARFRDMERLGANWIRIDFSWAAIQPDSVNGYHWGIYDRVVRVAGIHHIKILAVLGYTPDWAQEPRCARLVITWGAGQKCDPASYSAFAAFARTAAVRYRGTTIRAWEIWNEPNLSSYWKTARPDNKVLTDPKSYAVLANAAAYQIRRNGPGTLIITGGLSPLFQPVYPKGYQQGDFLARLLPYLHHDLFDGVGIHPYSWPALPTTAALYNAFYTVNNGPADFDLRAIMAHVGWGDKQLWGTEFGAPTSGVSNVVKATLHARPDHVSEAVQAQIITQGIREWYKIPNVGPLFVHSDSDQWLPQIRNEGGFGLRRHDGSAKPSYWAFLEGAKRLP